ncbi:TonB-dependent copper receptor [Oleisolibacter albus]|uniref:TonB-dependent copper receptor n=1 Tax=Oleisolibacter albus TaxID=2171757 RepID=UPI001EFE4C06|nr:TonB-dependent copper receptor [Oleisolibacter albus]
MPVMTMTPARLAACLLLSTAATAMAAAPQAGETRTDETRAGETLVLRPLVVTAPDTVSPLQVETDPKQPRQPVPANDGAGYLKSIPGFSVIRKGGTGGDPVFRGQSGSRLGMLIDGSPVLGGCGMRMDPPTAYAFPEAFDRITVLKGPQSVRYGGGLSGAAVLIERDTARFDMPGLRGNASLLGGTAGRNDQLVDVTAGMAEGYVRVIGTRAHSDDYEDGAGHDVHSAYNRSSGTLVAGWTPDAHTLLEASSEISEARAAYADRMMDGAKFDRNSHRLRFSRDDLSPLVARVEASAYYDYVDHVMDSFSLRRWTGGMMAPLSNPDREGYGGRTAVELRPREALTVTLGLDGNHDRHSTRNLTAAEYRAGVDYRDKPRVADLEFTTLGGFIEADYALDKDRVLVAGYRLNRTRAERRSVANAPEDTDMLHNGFLRLEQEVTAGAVPLTLYAGLGHSERAPDYWERNRLFTLTPEKTTQIDAGLLHRSGRWTGSLSLFANRIDDYMLLSSSTGKNVDASQWGGEAELGYAISAQWSVDASLAYVRGHNRSDDRPLAQMPPFEAKLGLTYDDGTWLAGGLARLVSPQNRVDTGWGNIAGTDIGTVGGFAVFSASAGWRPAQGVTLTLGIDNIFDRTYAEALSRAGTASLAGQGYVQTTRVNEPGRTAWLKGSVSF